MIAHAASQGAGVMFLALGGVGIIRTIYLEIAALSDRKTAQASIVLACLMLGIGTALVRL